MFLRCVVYRPPVVFDVTRREPSRRIDDTPILLTCIFPGKEPTPNSPHPFSRAPNDRYCGTFGYKKVVLIVMISHFARNCRKAQANDWMIWVRKGHYLGWGRNSVLPHLLFCRLFDPSSLSRRTPQAERESLIFGAMEQKSRNVPQE